MIHIRLTVPPGTAHPPPYHEEKKFEGKVATFLNRLLGLPVNTQSLLFSYFHECFEAQVAVKKSKVGGGDARAGQPMLTPPVRSRPVKLRPLS